MLFERLYEDNVAGKIDDARFARMSKRYEQEQGEISAKIKALRLELKRPKDSRWIWRTICKWYGAILMLRKLPSVWCPS